MIGRGIRSVAALTLTGAIALTGCTSIPLDPDGTLDRVRGGELRVGASPSEGLVDVDGGEVSGPLVEVVEAFAEEQDARAVWTVGSEEDLVSDIESGALDLAIGGMTDQTPWTMRVGVSRAFPALTADGTPLVMLVPLGENGFLSSLETFLDLPVPIILGIVSAAYDDPAVWAQLRSRLARGSLHWSPYHLAQASPPVGRCTEVEQLLRDQE